MFSDRSVARSSNALSYELLAARNATQYVMSAAPMTSIRTDGMRKTRRRPLMLSRLSRESSKLGLPQIPEAADGGDFHAGRFQLCPKSRYIDLDRVGCDLVVGSEEVLHDLLLAEHASRLRQEQLQERPLANGKLDENVVDLNSLGGD